MKKVLSLVLALVLTLSLAACSNSDTADNTENTDPNQTVTDNTTTDDNWPEGETISLVVAYTAGGGTDRSSRLLQPFLKKYLGCNVIIENVNGGGTEVATTSVANKPSDGNTILVTNYPDLNWTLAFQDPKGYDENTMEILMVSMIDPRIIITQKDSEWDTFTDFIESCKENPGKYAVAVGQNSGVHALALYLRDRLGIDYKVVPYDGGGQAGAAVIGNQVDLAFGDAFSRMDIRDSVKCIGVFGSEKNDIWSEGEPLDQQLEPYGVTVPTLNRYESYCVKSDLKDINPTRYEKLLQAFIDASQDPEYLEVVKQNNMESIAVYQTKDQIGDALDGQMEFLKDTIGPLLNAQ